MFAGVLKEGALLSSLATLRVFKSFCATTGYFRTEKPYKHFQERVEYNRCKTKLLAHLYVTDVLVR